MADQEFDCPPYAQVAHPTHGEGSTMVIYPSVTCVLPLTDAVMRGVMWCLRWYGDLRCATLRNTPGNARREKVRVGRVGGVDGAVDLYQLEDGYRGWEGTRRAGETSGTGCGHGEGPDGTLDALDGSAHWEA
eukprot:scaffold168347_cov31-Tisochrysis_lutea.AAC.1